MVLRVHGMDEGRVRFPVGPHNTISRRKIDFVPLHMVWINLFLINTIELYNEHIMKIHHPRGIAVLVLVAICSIFGTLTYQTKVGEAANPSPNPIIEWVLLQSSPKTTENAGISVTIQGYNFTPINNEVRTHGKVLKGGLVAINGIAVSDPSSPIPHRFVGMQPKIITFELPKGIPCALGDACPLDVVNANGTSNTVTFKL